MIFFPVAFLVFIALTLFLPVLFLLGYFQVLTLGFERLGISPGMTLFLLFVILIGSGINIPLTRKKRIYFEERKFFGLWRTPKVQENFIAINFGGAVVPILISLYFLVMGWLKGLDLEPVLIATILMIIVSKILAKVAPGRGITLPVFIPPVFSAIFALILTPDWAGFTAFISGTLGTLIGADILNIRRLQKYGGLLSIGGAGVFDGIFLIGIVASLLSSFKGVI